MSHPTQCHQPRRTVDEYPTHIAPIRPIDFSRNASRKQEERFGSATRGGSETCRASGFLRRSLPRCWGSSALPSRWPSVCVFPIRSCSPFFASRLPPSPRFSSTPPWPTPSIAFAHPSVDFPFNATVFLVTFLPLLLFHAALTIDVRELVEDAAPILTLAIVAVFVAAAGVALPLSIMGGVAPVVALLVGAIVATTDPAAVVGIFRDLGVPTRRVRLVEGESLLNDAAAIVLFTVLLGILADGSQPSFTEGALQVATSFGGGVVVGFLGGRLFGLVAPLLDGSKPAE